MDSFDFVLQVCNLNIIISEKRRWWLGVVSSNKKIRIILFFCSSLFGIHSCNISRRAYALDCLQYAIYLPEISTLPNLSQEKRIFCISKVFNFPSHHILSLGPSSFFKTKTCWLQPVFQSRKWKEKNIITFLDDC